VAVPGTDLGFGGTKSKTDVALDLMEETVNDK
jgi:hypothetical protein